jgi:hypothetical protein
VSPGLGQGMGEWVVERSHAPAGAQARVAGQAAVWMRPEPGPVSGWAPASTSALGTEAQGVPRPGSVRVPGPGLVPGPESGAKPLGRVKQEEGMQDAPERQGGNPAAVRPAGRGGA